MPGPPYGATAGLVGFTFLVTECDAHDIEVTPAG